MNSEIKGSLVWAGVIIGVALAASAALKAGYISDDTATRAVAMNGLMIAWYGNRMPKALAPSQAAARVARIGGWSMLISGLVYAGAWAFAPIDTALIVGCGAVLIGMAITMGYCINQRGRTGVA